MLTPEIEERLDQLAALPPNWNSYHAAPIDARAIAAVRRLLEALDGAWHPIAVPLSDGGVQVEWHERGADFEIEVDETGTYWGYLWYEDRMSTAAEGFELSEASMVAAARAMMASAK